MTNNTTPVTFAPDRLLNKYINQTALDKYFQALMTLNQKINLVSRETSSDDLIRLAAESVLPLEIMERENPDLAVDSYLDIGSGGGFPSIPLLLTGKMKTARLVERTAKKAAALEKIIYRLKLNAVVSPRTLEEIKFNRTFDLITLRYVKLTESLLKRIYGLLSENGHFVYYSSTDLKLLENRAVFYSFESPEPAVNKSLTIYNK